MKKTKIDFSAELEHKPFRLIWNTDMKYDLFYIEECIGEGMAPPDLVEEYVWLMNWAYNQGKKSL
jgi:hypothetical protein